MMLLFLITKLSPLRTTFVILSCVIVQLLFQRAAIAFCSFPLMNYENYLGKLQYYHFALLNYDLHLQNCYFVVFYYCLMTFMYNNSYLSVLIVDL